MDAYNYITNEAGGEECVGHTKRDHLNYVSRVKMSMVEGGNMQNVLDTLQERADNDPSFFYRLKFGEENNVSMCGIEPKSIFTDQDLAMSNAIPEVYPNSRHRLCLWHLQKNFVSHFGTLKTNPEFKNMFHKCLSGCDSESDFEDCWHKMVQKHGLEKKECIHAIPERYILKRWTKLAKSNIWDGCESDENLMSDVKNIIHEKDNIIPD
ncbi:protein FAR-RED IMPAIRED RESPONSE 1-like [Chenopodium quinoa]|uniref:protein FAR-RED IMPAIRED RESPONSE 1-like n=1 Tax=Chenopodium quinoa TaxID=63459 RepID=UPI000B791027|nr:protein FAR-RED IMPAIRED RESPONSE 1-like [Chenopodium quinoa]